MYSAPELTHSRGTQNRSAPSQGALFSNRQPEDITRCTQLTEAIPPAFLSSYVTVSHRREAVPPFSVIQWHTREVSATLRNTKQQSDCTCVNFRFLKLLFGFQQRYS